MGDQKEVKTEDPETLISKNLIKKGDVVMPFFERKYEEKKRYETPHDVPCPSGMGTEVADDPDINEWVMNHIPLKEEQKKELLNLLIKDSRKLEREKSVDKTNKEEIRKKKREKIPQKEGRVPVKEGHNSIVTNDTVSTLQ